MYNKLEMDQAERKEIQRVMNSRLVKNNAKNIYTVAVIREFPVSCLNCGEDHQIKNVEFNGTRQLISSASTKNGIKDYIDRMYPGLHDCIDTRRVGTLVGESVKRIVDIDDAGLSNISKIVIGAIKDKSKEDASNVDASEDSSNTEKSEEYILKNCVRISNSVEEELVKAFMTLVGDNISNIGNLSAKEINNYTKEYKKVIESIDNANVGDWECMLGGNQVGGFFTSVNSAVSVANGISLDTFKGESHTGSRREELLVRGSDVGAAGLFNLPVSSPTMLLTYTFDVNTFIDNEMNFNGVTDRKIAIEKFKNIFAAFLDAIFYSAPTGKQNTDMSHPRPALVFISAGNMGSDYRDIFSKTIDYDRDCSVIDKAVDRLIDYRIVNDEEVDFVTDKNEHGYIGYLYTDRDYNKYDNDVSSRNVVVDHSFRRIVERVVEDI